MLKNRGNELIQRGGVRKTVLERGLFVVQNARTVSKIPKVADSAVEKT